MRPPECPYERLAVAPAGDLEEYTERVIHDTPGRRVSPSLSGPASAFYAAAR